MTSNGVTLSAVAVDPTTGAYTVTSSAPDQPGVDVITATFIPAPGSPYQASPTAQAGLLRSSSLSGRRRGCQQLAKPCKWPPP